jgi:hypothetical protein
VILLLKIIAAMVGGIGGTRLFWALKEKKVHFPVGHGLPFSRQHFAWQYWVGVIGYTSLLLGGAAAYVLL